MKRLLFATLLSVPAPACAAVSCDRSLAEFRHTGTIVCGRFLWDLHPEHARQIEDPLAYFEKYEKFFDFMQDLTGYTPQTPIPIHERCAPNKPRGPECPKGNLEHAYPAYRLGNALYADAAVVGRDIVFTANHPRRPLFASFAHEIGHMFSPFDARDSGYRWDAAMTESWADNFALFGYGVYSELKGLKEAWYWDGFCERKAGQRPPCDTFMSGVEDYAWMDADMALWEYRRSGRRFEDMVPLPVNSQGSPHGRGHILTGMLVALYREFRQQGRLEEFFQGFRGFIRTYHASFPYPSDWTVPEGAQSAALLAQKANVFAFLLSAKLKTDLTRRFQEWRWPISPETVLAAGAAASDGWSEPAVSRELSKLLREKRPPST